MKPALLAVSTLLASVALGWARAAAPSKAAPAFLPEEYELTSGELRLPAAKVALGDLEPLEAGPPAYGSDSPVFRMRSKAAEYGNVEVSLELLDRGLRSGAFTQKNAWDGIHLWLRYQSPAHLYAVSVNRRDDRIVIKKKVPGGPSNGGTYFDLCPTVRFPVPYGDWQKVSASAINHEDGSVLIRLKVNGKVVLEALDDGSEGGAPITAPGRVGLRADNADFEFRQLKITGL